VSGLGNVNEIDLNEFEDARVCAKIYIEATLRVRDSSAATSSPGPCPITVGRLVVKLMQRRSVFDFARCERIRGAGNEY